MNRLLLINNHNRPLVVHLAKYRATSLRKDRYVAESMYLGKNETVDVCEFFGVNYDEAREMVDRSDDIKAFSRKNMIIVKDEVSLDVAKILKEVKFEHKDAQFEALKYAVHEDGTPIIPPKKPQRSKSSMNEGPKPDIKTDVKVEGGKETEVSISAPTNSIPGDQKSLVLPDIPSVKWSKEKLLDYAKSMGIEVASDISKNALLRKIRGV